MLPLIVAMMSLLGAAEVRAAPGPELGVWLAPWDPLLSTAPAVGECAAEVNPFSYAFASDYSIKSAYPRLLAGAGLRRPGMRFIPVLVNDVLEPESGQESLKSRELLTRLLSERRRMKEHVAELLALAAREDFDGLELDYERIPLPLWGNFVEFVELLAEGLHARGKKLNVALEPGLLHRHASVARRHWPRLARCVDGIKFMCYYERGEPSQDPGPGNSLDWVERTSRKALELIGPEKLWVSFSLAGTDWSHRGVKRLHYKQVQKIIKESGARVRWDKGHSAPYIVYRDAQGKHELWFENEESLRRKVEAVSRLGVRKVALWYLGRQHPDLKSLGLCRRTA